MSHRPENIRRIAVPVLAGMGNGLMAQPMVRQLARAFPQAELAILARNQSIAGVFESLAEVDNVRVFGNEPKQFFRLLRDLRRWRADLCVIPYPSNRWQYSLLATSCGAKRCILHGYRVGRWRALHDLPAERVEAVPDLHDVPQNLRLLHPLGIEPDEQMAPVFPVDAEEGEAGLARLRDAAPDAPGAPRYCAVHAGSGRTIFAMSKRWPPDRYAELISRLRNDFDLTPILLEGPEDEGVGELLQRHVDVPVLQLTGPLRDAAAVLAAARLYVGSDSGLAHLAAAVGTPPVTLFGPARPDEVCPFGYRHLVVQTPATCAPCFRYPQQATTPHVQCRPPYCINRIELDRVITAVEKALAVGSAEPTSA